MGNGALAIGPKLPRPSSTLPARTLVLGGINYVELSFCFGVIYALNYQSLQMASRPITAFYFSIITQLTIGYGDVSPKGWMRLVAATQGLIGALLSFQFLHEL